LDEGIADTFGLVSEVAWYQRWAWTVCIPRDGSAHDAPIAIVEGGGRNLPQQAPRELAGVMWEINTM
jgi:hypothetical protein